MSFYYLLYKNLTGPDAYNPAYRMVAKMPFRSSRSTGDYEVWMRLPAEPPLPGRSDLAEGAAVGERTSGPPG